MALECGAIHCARETLKVMKFFSCPLVYFCLLISRKCSSIQKVNSRVYQGSGFSPMFNVSVDDLEVKKTEREKKNAQIMKMYLN